MKFYQRIIFICGLLVASPSLWAADNVQRQAYIITLQNQLPETLIPVIKPLLAEGDAVTGYGNELIITTHESRINNIRNIVDSIDAPLRNLLITVKDTDNSEQLDQQRGFSGGIQRDKVYIGTGEPVTPAPGGVTIYSDGLAYSSAHTRQTFSTRAEQQIRAVEGQPAFLYTGQSIKLPSQDSAGNPYTVEADALQGVYVTARLAGERVILTISTRNDQFKGPHHDQEVLIDTRQLSTTVSGRMGEWIDLGGISLGENNSGSSQVKKTTTRSGSIGNIAVKITALD